jgi:hypothetical protein
MTKRQWINKESPRQQQSYQKSIGEEYVYLNQEESKRHQKI